MTIPVPPQLQPLAAARQVLDAALTRQTAAGATLAGLRTQRDTLLRRGDGAGAAALDPRIVTAQTALTTAATDVATATARLAKLSDGLISPATTPEALVGSLDAALPITLLPVRLEARYGANAVSLNVRIYPDQIHVDSHERELTPDEVTAGTDYWRARWLPPSAADPTFTTPWTTLTASIGPRRAAWIVQATTPTNMNAIGTSTAPVFPTVPTRGTVWSRAARATALPDRWAIVGIQGGRTVFRKWTGFIPDYLAATVSPDDSATTAPLDSSIVDPDARWLVDFTEATRVGMATTIGAADLAPGYSLASGVDRLIAIGVDWTMTPDEATSRLEALLGSHHFTDGVSFLSQGVPTNATAAARAGAPPPTDALTARLNPARADVVSDLQDASADKLAQLTGLSAGARGTLRRAPGAENREAECASRMFDALWESTLGYYLAQFMRPNLDDAAITALRDHAVRFVAPFGPAAPLRIGKQPYGVLPVVASARYRGAKTSPLEQRLAELLVKLRGMWLAGERAVPRMGRTNDPSKDVLEVLQSTPQSSTLRFRYIYGPASVKNTKGLELHAAAQELVMRALGQFIAWPSLPEMVGYTADARDYPLNVPLVAPPDAKSDAVLGKNYLKEIAALVRSPGSYDALAARQDADALLEALLAHAAERELHTTTMRRVEAFRLKQGAITAMPALVAFRTAEMVAVEAPTAPPSTTAVTLETPGDVARLVIPALTGTRTVRDDTAAALVRKDLLGGAAKNTAQFLAALDWLADRPVGVLDRAARGVLDACSFRLDAWLTSLASRRLGDLRAARPTGTHIGGYSWLDDLHPSARADSLGYVHAPSIAHATTAAILRSGHLAHHDTEHSALNIDLSSDRVRLALHLLEGTAQGQPLAALLGYRFERGLRQRGLPFAKFIYPIRQLAPLRPTGEQPAPGVQVESIAARDVVDGVTLLERWRTQGAQLIAGLTQVAAERTVIGQELDALAATYDAVSDLLIAEAVHQLALGNTERAGATLAATDAQTPAPAPAVVRTPRTGRSFAQRVLIVLANDTPPVAWPVANLDARARAEPRLNAWIGSVLGDPARIRVAVETTGPAGKQEVNIADLGLSPLSLVLASEDGSEGRASELEERIVHLVGGAIVAPTADTSIRLLDAPAVGAPTGTVGLAALRALLGWLRSLITEHRAIDARDFGLPQDLKASGVDLAELTARSNAVVVAVRKARTTLANLVAAVTPPKEPALRKALMAMADLGVRDALPNVAPGGADAAAVLLEQTQAVSRTMGTALARVDAEDADFAGASASPTPPDADARAEHFVLRVRMLLGNHFPILPRFAAANGPELAASLGQRTALVGGDQFAPHAWLARLSLVRPSVDKLARVLSAAEVAGASAGDLAVLQIPFTPGERWLALPASGDAQAEVAIVAAWDGTPDPLKPLAGLFCDAWSEIIPSAVETTGVSFHYDAPGARAPQTILVAVPPDPAATTWSFDALLDTVLEAHDLGQIRAVGPKELTHLGVMLPCIYLPQSFSKDVPSVRLDSIVTKSLAASGISTRVLGKS